MDAADWSAAETARQLGLTRSAVSQILSGKNTPASQTLRLLRIKVVKQPDPEENDGFREGIHLKRAEPNVQLPTRGALSKVPVVSYSSAGRGQDYQDIAAQLDEHIYAEIKDRNAFALTVDGSSMLPDYHHGDRVIFSPNSEAKTGDAVVCRLKDGRVLFKKLRRLADGTILLESTNPEFETVRVKPEEIKFLYRAAQHLRKL